MTNLIDCPFQFKDQIHFYQRVRENEPAFGCKTGSEIIKECLKKLKEDKEIVVLKDNRFHKYSDHVRIFKTNANGLVAIPCYGRDDGIIELLTIFDVYNSDD